MSLVTSTMGLSTRTIDAKLPKCQAFQADHGLTKGHTLPEDCQDEILLFALSLIHCPKKTDRLISVDSGRFHQQIEFLNQAHTKMEELSGVLPFAQLSRSHHDLYKPQMDRLREEITVICKGVHKAKEGPRFLREIVDTGHYLKVLKIYIQAVPEAIWNGANTKERNEGFERTLLHNAIAPNCPRTFSKSFAKFLIEIIKKHGMLDILSHKDSYDKTALQHLQDSFAHWPGGLVPEKIEIEQSLKELTPAEPAPLIPPIPAPRESRSLVPPTTNVRPLTTVFASSVIAPTPTVSRSVTPSRVKIICLKVCSFVSAGIACIFKAIAFPFIYLVRCFRSKLNAT